MADEKTLNPKGKTLTIELAVGAFILAGFACLAYLSIRLARMDMFGSKGYEVVAVFSDCGGLKPGATVSIAGVDVGRVRKITLKNDKAEVVMSLDEHLTLRKGALARIKTRGLIGEKFIELVNSPSGEKLGHGARIGETVGAVDISSIISRFVGAGNEAVGLGGNEYSAVFTNCGSLAVGAPVMVAGVPVGHVSRIELARENARVTMVIEPQVEIGEETIASIKAKGLLGGSYIELSLGAGDILAPGSEIIETNPAVDIVDLLGKFVHGNLKK